MHHHNYDNITDNYSVTRNQGQIHKKIDTKCRLPVRMGGSEVTPAAGNSAISDHIVEKRESWKEENKEM